MPQPRPALQRLSAPAASLHNGDRESEFEGFKGVKWLKINLTRQLKHGLAFSCLWQLVQVYFRRFWGDLSAEKGLSTGFWSALQRRVSSSASLRLALERHTPSSVCHLLALQRPASGLQLDLQLSSPAPVALSASWEELLEVRRVRGRGRARGLEVRVRWSGGDATGRSWVGPGVHFIFSPGKFQAPYFMCALANFTEIS